MGSLDKLFIAAEALQKGKSLQNSETWKKAGMLSVPLTAVITAIAKLADWPIPDSDINAIVYGIVVAVGAFNTYVHAATSEKVGL